jgi:hypothetical protein
MNRWTGICFLLILYHQSKAQVLHNTITTAYTRLTSYSKQQTDVFSFQGNQAALASIKHFGIGFQGEKRFLLEDLGQYSLAVALPTHSGGFGLSAANFGSASYNQTELGLAYGRSLGEKADIGVQFNYNTITIPTYGNTSSINFDAGLILHITDQLHTGVHVYNPASVQVGKLSEEKLPAIISAGVGYDVSQKVFLGADIEKTEDQPVNVNVGIQYRPDDKLLTRAGISTASTSYYFGLGLIINDFRLDATASVHPYLGVTPGLLLIYSINK